MQVVIASNDQAVATRLRTALQKLGIECPLTHVVSYESAQLLAASNGDGPLTLIFFGGQQLDSPDLTLLSQLCAIAGERLKVVAVSQSFSAGAILQAVRSGAVDCLSLSGNLELELKHVIDRVEATQREHVRLGSLFTVVAPVGGAGASVVAANLAAAIAQRQETCALLDLHWRGGDQVSLFNCTPRHTLLSLAGKTESLDPTMLQQTLVRHDCGVHLLASPEPFSDYRQIRPELVQKIVQLARGLYATVVVDLEDCEHLDQVRTLAASDQIIVVLRPDFVSLVRTKKLLNHLLSSGVSRDHLTLIANRTGHVKELPIAQAEEALGVPVTHRLPDDASAVNEAINLGVPLVVGCRSSKVTTEIMRLSESLLGVPSRPTASWINSKLLPLKTAACLFGAVNTSAAGVWPLR